MKKFLSKISSLVLSYTFGLATVISFIIVLGLILHFEGIVDFSSNIDPEKILIGLRIEELTQNVPFSQGEAGDYGGKVITAYIDYIYFPPENLRNGEKFCIEGFTIRNLNTFILGSGPLEYTLIGDDICLSVGMNIFASPNSNKALLYASDNNPFFYPFDSRVVNFDILLDAFAVDQNGVKIPILPEPENMDVVVTLVPPRWQQQVAQTKRLGAGSGVLEISLSLSHPLFYRALTLLLSLLVLVILLTFHRIKKLEDFLQIAIAMFLGLWGIQGVLVPQYVDFPILVNYVILLLYLYLSIFIGIEIHKKTK